MKALDLEAERLWMLLTSFKRCPRLVRSNTCEDTTTKSLLELEQKQTQDGIHAEKKHSSGRRLTVHEPRNIRTGYKCTSSAGCRRLCPLLP